MSAREYSTGPDDSIVRRAAQFAAVDHRVLVAYQVVMSGNYTPFPGAVVPCAPSFISESAASSFDCGEVGVGDVVFPATGTARRFPRLAVVAGIKAVSVKWATRLGYVGCSQLLFSMEAFLVPDQDAERLGFPLIVGSDAVRNAGYLPGGVHLELTDGTMVVAFDPLGFGSISSRVGG